LKRTTYSTDTKLVTFKEHDIYRTVEKLSIYPVNIYRASVVVSSCIERFDVSGVVGDKNWCAVTTMLDKKPLVLFEEIRAPLQQTDTENRRENSK